MSPSPVPLHRLTAPANSRAGVKAKVSLEPLDLSALPKSGPRRVEKFCKEFLSVPKGKGARGPFRLRPFQREIVRGCFPTRGRPRQALVSLPRGNGKSTLAAAIGLYSLFADGEEGAQVLCVATDHRQALIVFQAARRMVELSPELSARAQIYGGDDPRIVVPGTDSIMRALPATESALQGWDPSLAIIDELHVVDEVVWQAVTLAAGKRSHSLVLAISTPADSEDSVMWSLVKHAREAADHSFYFREWAAPEGCATDDEEAWKIANPALGDFLHIDALRATQRTTREAAFRRFRLGQWLAGGDAWLPFGSWAAVADPKRVVADAEKVCLFFDGSASGDSTALVGCTLGPDPHVFVVEAWENPGDPRWRVPRSNVDRAVRAAFEKYDVIELACDPWGWRSEIEAWAEAFPGRVLEWPTNVISRIGPASDRFYQLVLANSLTHDGDSRMARHVGNARAKSTPSGDVLRKDSKTSVNKIDLAVAAVGAVDRAAFFSRQTSKRKRAISW